LAVAVTVVFAGELQAAMRATTTAFFAIASELAFGLPTSSVKAPANSGAPDSKPPSRSSVLYASFVSFFEIT
jgi:hypothetical protein